MTVNVWITTGYLNLHNEACSGELGKPLPCQVTPVLLFFSITFGAFYLGFIPMGGRSLEALIKYRAKVIPFTVKCFMAIILFFL